VGRQRFLCHALTTTTGGGDCSREVAGVTSDLLIWGQGWRLSHTTATQEAAHQTHSALAALHRAWRGPHSFAIQIKALTPSSLGRPAVGRQSFAQAGSDKALCTPWHHPWHTVEDCCTLTESGVPGEEAETVATQHEPCFPSLYNPCVPKYVREGIAAGKLRTISALVTPTHRIAARHRGTSRSHTLYT
jgi:hypothetical protein